MARLFEITGCDYVEVTDAEEQDLGVFFHVGYLFNLRDTLPLRRALTSGMFGPYEFAWENGSWNAFRLGLWGEYQVTPQAHGATLSVSPIQGWDTFANALAIGPAIDALSDDGLSSFVQYPKRATGGMSLDSINAMGSGLIDLAAIDLKACRGVWTSPKDVKSALQHAKRKTSGGGFFGWFGG